MEIRYLVILDVYVYHTRAGLRLIFVPSINLNSAAALLVGKLLRAFVHIWTSEGQDEACFLAYEFRAHPAVAIVKVLFRLGINPKSELPRQVGYETFFFD